MMATDDYQGRIVDAWMQQLTPEFVAHPMFDSLRRWSHGSFASADLSLESTIRAMDDAGVRIGMCSAWWGRQGPLLTNDRVASYVREYPARLAGVASVDLHHPMVAVRELSGASLNWHSRA
jgi:uncharacterized protein